MIIKKFLTITATGEARITTKRPKARWGEVSYRLNIDMPDAWGEVVGDINVKMPEPPEAVVLEAVNDA